MTTDAASALVAFEQQLSIPRAAQAYGIDTRELRHNHFLHFLLSPIAGTDFRKHLIRELATACSAKLSLGDSPNQLHAWQALASSAITYIDSRYNIAGTRGRPDEVVTCVNENGERFVIVIEMKVKAEEYEGQLSGYVENERKQAEIGGASVLGVLLRIPGEDVVETEFADIAGRTLRDCIHTAWSQRDSAEADSEVTRKLGVIIRDYLATLDFLSLMDQTIVNAGNPLFEIYRRAETKQKNQEEVSLIELWVLENWRWCCERIMREVAFRVGRALKDRFPQSKIGAYGTKDGAAADLEFRKPQKGECLADGAGLYLHWKLGHGFHVRAAVNNYGNSTDESRRILQQFVRSVQQGLSKLPGIKTAPAPSARDNSCAVARWKNESFDVPVIVDDFVVRAVQLHEILGIEFRSFVEANLAESLVADPVGLTATVARESLPRDGS